MSEISLSVLIIALIVLFLLSAFFSGTETALMSLNRFRLKHLAESGHKGAIRAQTLLEQPDRLIGMILLGNNIVNILLTLLAAHVGFRIHGSVGYAIATALLVPAVLIFAETTPKTLGAIHSEKVAFPATAIYKPLLVITYPIVWLINFFANGILLLFGVSTKDIDEDSLSHDELRSVVSDSGQEFGRNKKSMLLSVLDLETRKVEDIMIPRREIIGIDISDEWDEVMQQLIDTSYTRLLIFEESIDKIIGFFHVRNLARHHNNDEFDIEVLKASLREPYFIPEGTQLTEQLVNFRRERRRHGLVVDEYGDIQGLVTLEDLLEEIVGEFTTDPGDMHQEIHVQSDGSYIIDAGAHVRDINQVVGSVLHTHGPKTLNGLILEHMELIPDTGTCMLIDNYPVEIMKIQDNAVKVARLTPTRINNDKHQNG